MEKQYTPQVGDQVFLDGKASVRYVVAIVNESDKTARVKTATGPSVLSEYIPWAKLLPLDESQVASRIVREATENH